MTVQVLRGDCIRVMKSLKDNSVDAVVTDPPYGLEFMGKEWDGSNGFRRSLNPNDSGRDNVFGRTSKTSPEYRATGVVPQSGRRPVSDQLGAHDEGYRNMRGKEPVFQEWCRIWASECLRILKPGGYLLAFGGTRTYHRLACGVEDAGFEIRDSLHWIYGSGFPKSLDVSKAIDKAAGAEREIVGYNASRARPNRKYDSGAIGNIGAGRGNECDRTDNGATLTAPATEDAARWEGWGTALKPAHEPIVLARKSLTGTVAANVLEYGTGGLNIAACRVAHASEADRAESVTKNQHAKFGSKARQNNVFGDMSQHPPGDYDGAAGRWPPNILLDEEMAAVMDTQSGHSVSRIGNPRSAAGPGDGWGMVCTGSEYDDTGGASRFFPCFKYQAKAGKKERPKGDVNHPTIKPVALMQWLVRLVTPPGGIVLDPFAGSGTTGEACLEEGFNCILIEREPDYIKLIRTRLDSREPTLWD